MNNKFGLAASVSALICTLLFLAGLITWNEELNYWSCLVLSWAYIGSACALAQEAPGDRRGIASAGIAVAVLYSLLTNLVYYTQLTTVSQGAADPAILRILSYGQGSWMFGLDLLGYGLMALSTFLIGLSLSPVSKTGKAMKLLLMLHGLFFPACVVMPALGMFPEGSGGDGGVFALMGWCLYFAPVMLLAALHFRGRIAVPPCAEEPAEAAG